MRPTRSRALGSSRRSARSSSGYKTSSETLPDPRDDPSRAWAMDRARFDASPEAALMRRYETAATTDLHRALNLLMKGSQGRPDRRRSGRRPGARRTQ